MNWIVAIKICWFISWFIQLMTDTAVLKLIYKNSYIVFFCIEIIIRLSLTISNMHYFKFCAIFKCFPHLFKHERTIYRFIISCLMITNSFISKHFLSQVDILITSISDVKFSEYIANGNHLM